jgi:rhodanese-related sulfurtransferase
MKKIVLTILVAAAVAFGQAGKQQASQVKVLTRAEMDQLLTRPSEIMLIDLRRPDELTSNGGFPVYLSIQFNDLEKSLAWIPKDRTIVLVSNHAGRAGRAYDTMIKAGFKVAGAIGAQVYESEGGKLTKILPPPPNPNAK